MSKKLFKSKTGIDVTIEDIMADIYDTTIQKRANINATAERAADKIQTINDVIVVMPQLISLQEASIRNDEAMIKLAGIALKYNGKMSDVGDDSVRGLLTSEEREMIIEAAKSMKKPGASTD